MAWCFSDEATDLTKALLNRLSNLTDSAIVPALWLYEVVNVTELAVRKGRITEGKARAFLDSLGDLPIEIENPTRTQMFVSVRALVGHYRLTAYDASYLERLSVTICRWRLPITRWRKPRGLRVSTWSSYDKVEGSSG